MKITKRSSLCSERSRMLAVRLPSPQLRRVINNRTETFNPLSIFPHAPQLLCRHSWPDNSRTFGLDAGGSLSVWRTVPAMRLAYQDPIVVIDVQGFVWTRLIINDA